MDTSTIKSAINRHPFKAFTMRMNDGREFFIPHPEFAGFSDKAVLAIHFTTKVLFLLDPGRIASLEFDPRTGDTESTY